MTIRRYLTSLSVIILIALLTNCGSPDSPDFGDSHEDVVKYVLHSQKGKNQFGSVLFENNKIIHTLDYKSITWSGKQVTEYYFEENILVSRLRIFDDPDGSILNESLNAPYARYQYKQVFVEGKKMYFTKDFEGNSQYMYREYSDHFSAPSIHRLTLPAK